MALDLDSGMQAADRRRELSEAAKALTAYLHQHLNFTQVADAYRSGHFRAGQLQMRATPSVMNLQGLVTPPDTPHITACCWPFVIAIHRASLR